MDVRAHSTPQKVIARGIASPWSDYDRQAGSILGDLRAAGFEVVPAEQLRGAVSPTWLTSNEAFEIAYRGARSSYIGKMSPAQLTAALNALSDHLGGQYEASPAPPSSRASSGTEPNKET